jgi:hypothetical protein
MLSNGLSMDRIVTEVTFGKQLQYKGKRRGLND